MTWWLAGAAICLAVVTVMAIRSGQFTGASWLVLATPVCLAIWWLILPLSVWDLFVRNPRYPK